MKKFSRSFISASSKSGDEAAPPLPLFPPALEYVPLRLPFAICTKILALLVRKYLPFEQSSLRLSPTWQPDIIDGTKGAEFLVQTYLLFEHRFDSGLLRGQKASPVHTSCETHCICSPAHICRSQLRRLCNSCTRRSAAIYRPVSPPVIGSEPIGARQPWTDRS